MIAKSVKAEIVQSNARAAGDTGSPEVQVALHAWPTLTVSMC